MVVIFNTVRSCSDGFVRDIGLLELRAKFEEDKAKIAKYKESRRFKPY